MPRYGPNKTFVKVALWLSWPLMIAGKRMSSWPVFKWIINPFFAYPFNEVTAVPINVSIPLPDNVPLPKRLLEAVIRQAANIFILDHCICRNKLGCTNHPRDVGCMALGPAVKKIHPSHGREATVEEAMTHIEKAAEAGLIANIAHVWIDPVAFWSTPFNRLMFICFCDDCCCLYRTHMRKRGPNLEKAYRRLPGIEIIVDTGRCTGCGLCVEKCFVADLKIRDGHAVVGAQCKGCGRCVEICPEQAVSLSLANEKELIRQIMERINAVADITSKG